MATRKEKKAEQAPEESKPEIAVKPATPPKHEKKPKLPPKNKSRLPRKQKKALKKAQALQ
jgi:hypothetical protein